MNVEQINSIKTTFGFLERVKLGEDQPITSCVACCAEKNNILCKQIRNAAECGTDIWRFDDEQRKIE